MKPPAVRYQVRAEKDGRVFIFGMTCREDDSPLAKAMDVLGPAWFGGCISVAYIPPPRLASPWRWSFDR